MKQTIESTDIYAAIFPPYRQPSRFAEFLRSKFPNWWRPPKHVVVFEHSEGDWDHAHCMGTPVRGWRITADGPMPIAPHTTISQASVGPWFRECSIWRFVISADRHHVILARLAGPRAGSGAVYEVVVRDGKVRLANPSHQWKA